MEQLTQHREFLKTYYAKIRDFEFELQFWRDVTKAYNQEGEQNAHK